MRLDSLGEAFLSFFTFGSFVEQPHHLSLPGNSLQLAPSTIHSGQDTRTLQDQGTFITPSPELWLRNANPDPQNGNTGTCSQAEQSASQAIQQASQQASQSIQQASQSASQASQQAAQSASQGIQQAQNSASQSIAAASRSASSAASSASSVVSSIQSSADQAISRLSASILSAQASVTSAQVCKSSQCLPRLGEGRSYPETSRKHREKHPKRYFKREQRLQLQLVCAVNHPYSSWMVDDIS